MSTRQRSVLAALVAALGMSCAGPSAGEADPKPGTAWKDMTKEERAAFMKKTVLPKMKAEFVAVDAKEFGEMNCATCHGDGAKDKSFKMPNPKLPKLVATEEGFKKLSVDHPDMMKFMGQKVVPDMAALLGVAPYDPKTHQGFGCFACHTMKE
jgi:hypothetical protein